MGVMDVGVTLASKTSFTDLDRAIRASDLWRDALAKGFVSLEVMCDADHPNKGFIRSNWTSVNAAKSFRVQLTASVNRLQGVRASEPMIYTRKLTGKTRVAKG